MHEQIEKTISDLNDHIQEILEKGSDKEREALPELVNSLTNLYREYKFL